MCSNADAAGEVSSNALGAGVGSNCEREEPGTLACSKLLEPVHNMVPELELVHSKRVPVQVHNKEPVQVQVHNKVREPELEHSKALELGHNMVPELEQVHSKEPVQVLEHSKVPGQGQEHNMELVLVLERNMVQEPVLEHSKVRVLGKLACSIADAVDDFAIAHTSSREELGNNEGQVRHSNHHHG